MGEALQALWDLPLWVKLIVAAIAIGLILLIWQPWSSGSSSAASTSSVSPGPAVASGPPPGGSSGPPPGGPGGSTPPPLPSQVQQGSGFWVGAATAASTPLETAQGTFDWINSAQFSALAAQSQPIFYEPLPGDFVQLSYSKPGQLNTSGLAGGTPLYAEEPSAQSGQLG